MASQEKYESFGSISSFEELCAENIKLQEIVQELTLIVRQLRKQEEK